MQCNKRLNIAISIFIAFVLEMTTKSQLNIKIYFDVIDLWSIYYYLQISQVNCAINNDKLWN